MSKTLNKAFADVSRSYMSAKSSVNNKASSESILANAPGGQTSGKADFAKSKEQLQHFKGWVYTAIRPIAQRIAGQPIRVGKVGSKNPSGKKSIGGQFNDIESLTNHPLLDLLANPNNIMVGWSLIFSTVASLELTGKSLWWLPEQKEILPVPTSWIQGYDSEGTSYESFKIRPPGSSEAITLPREEICYIAYPNPGDPWGSTSPLQAVGAAVDADESITLSQSSMFKRNINPSVILTVGKDANGHRPRLTSTQRRTVIDAIKKRYAGVAKHGEPLILDSMIEDVKRLFFNTTLEMDYLRSSQKTKDQILQGFGVSPYITGGSEPGSRAASAMASQHFVEYTINPKIELISQSLTEWLGPMFGGIKVWIEPAVCHDAEMRLKWAELLSKNGVITAHELRNLSPLDLQQEALFNGQLVGGKNMQTTNLIEEGLQEMVHDSVAENKADEILHKLEVGSKDG